MGWTCSRLAVQIDNRGKVEEVRNRVCQVAWKGIQWFQVRVVRPGVAGVERRRAPGKSGGLGAHRKPPLGPAQRHRLA